MQPLADQELERLLAFVGYGNPDGRVWFLGMEEGGGGEDNLRRRLQFEPVEDLGTAHTKLGILKHHSGSKVIQPTWRGMCIVMLLLMGEEVSREGVRKYQAEQLGRKGRDTFLLELMPLPKPSMAECDYAELIPQINSREDYYTRIMEKRVVYLRNFLAEHRPNAVIGYGKAYWGHYQSLFPGTSFATEGQFVIARGRPSILLCDHFTSRTMNKSLPRLVNALRGVFDDASA